MAPVHHPRYSVIVPVYDRPQEVEEFLQSLARQEYRDFECLIVEDGSSKRCDHIVDRFRDQFPLQYIFKQNEGPGPARNVGFRHAKGDFFVVFDSDCLLPPTYFNAVNAALATQPFDAWGGPDKGHENFTPLQRAMGHTMSSVLTTGGIRGNKRHVGHFQPRSFNMGMSKEVFAKTQGFHFDRFAEDIELSIRVRQAGFTSVLVPDAFVYHKRRTSLSGFYRQVSNFGKGRALIGKVHRGEIKAPHWFPTLFTVGLFSLPLLPLFSWPLFYLGAGGYALYLGLVFAYALYAEKNLWVAILCVPSTLVQLVGYGTGLAREYFFSKPSLKK